MEESRSFPFGKCPYIGYSSTASRSPFPHKGRQRTRKPNSPINPNLKLSISPKNQRDGPKTASLKSGRILLFALRPDQPSVLLLDGQEHGCLSAVTHGGIGGVEGKVHLSVQTREDHGVTAVVLIDHIAGVQQLFFMDPFAIQPSVGASGDSDHIARGVKFGSDQEELALLGGVYPTAVGNTPGIPDRFVRTEELNGLRDQVGEVIRKLGGYDQVIL